MVSIALDHPHEHYTNLDVIQGRVFLRVPNPTNVSSIVVKLEGESKTRLLAPIHPSRPDKQRPVLEVHKVLYKTQVVWPANMSQDDLLTNNKTGFTMQAGNFEYPFRFKVSRTVLSSAQMLIEVDSTEYLLPCATSDRTHFEHLFRQHDTRIRKDTDTASSVHAATIPYRVPWRG